MGFDSRAGQGRQAGTAWREVRPGPFAGAERVPVCDACDRDLDTRGRGVVSCLSCQIRLRLQN